MKDPCTKCLLKMICIEACDSFCEYLKMKVEPYPRIPRLSKLDKRIVSGWNQIWFVKEIVKNERRNNHN